MYKWANINKRLAKYVGKKEEGPRNYITKDWREKFTRESFAHFSDRKKKQPLWACNYFNSDVKTLQISKKKKKRENTKCIVRHSHRILFHGEIPSTQRLRKYVYFIRATIFFFVFNWMKNIAYFSVCVSKKKFKREIKAVNVILNSETENCSLWMTVTFYFRTFVVCFFKRKN